MQIQIKSCSAVEKSVLFEGVEMICEKERIKNKECLTNGSFWLHLSRCAQSTWANSNRIVQLQIWIPSCECACIYTQLVHVTLCISLFSPVRKFHFGKAKKLIILFGSHLINLHPFGALQFIHIPIEAQSSSLMRKQYEKKIEAIKRQRQRKWAIVVPFGVVWIKRKIKLLARSPCFTKFMLKYK